MPTKRCCAASRSPSTAFPRGCGIAGNPPSLRAQRSNPWRGKASVDCFVALLLAMTVTIGQPSAIMRALGLDIDRVQRLARRHEQAVALLAAEAEIGAGLGQADLADARAVGCEDLDAII